MTAIEQDGQAASTPERRRRHERSPTSGNVAAEVMEAEEAALIGLGFDAGIVEISPCGLRLETDTEIIGASILHLRVQIDGFSKRMFLSTEVRWCSLEASGRYHVGVEILANPLADVEEWCDFQRQEWFRHKADQA